MNDDGVDALIREAFEAVDPPPELVDQLTGRRRHWRFEAVVVGLAAAAALALFWPWAGEPVAPTVPSEVAAAAFVQPPDTRIVGVQAAGAQKGWPEMGAEVDLIGVVEKDDGWVVEPAAENAPMFEDAELGSVAVALTAEQGERVKSVLAKNGTLSLAVVLPDGRRVIELRESSPTRVGDVVDVLVTAPTEDGVKTWTALEGAQVVMIGESGPMVALSAQEAREAVLMQAIGRIRLSRHLD